MTHKIQKNLIELKKYGYTKINNILTKKEVNKAKKIINSLKESKKSGTFWAPHYYDTLFIKFLSKNKIKKILIPTLNDPYYKSISQKIPNYILGEYIAIKNEGKFLNLHIDSWIPSSSKKTWMVQVVFLLDDRTKKNGCTTIIKKSHRSDKYSNRLLKKYSYLEGKQGDVIIWDSRLWHGRSAGIPDHSWALVATMQSWFIKQRFDYANYMPAEILKKLNKFDKQILGMCSKPPKSHRENLYIRRGFEVFKKK